eukprot:4487514-Prymnesium_polylepis.1
MMVMAAAVVKPDTTACARNSTTNPRPVRPAASCIEPANNAASIAQEAYSSGQLSCASSPSMRAHCSSSLKASRRPVLVSSETIATGPTDSCGEPPMNAYTSGGTHAVYSPWTTGSPAMDAYDMAWGTAITATVSPAIHSDHIGSNPACAQGSEPLRSRAETRRDAPQQRA